MTALDGASDVRHAEAIDDAARPHVAEPTAVYRFLGTGGALLYVGLTANPPSRFLQHGTEKNWWPLVTDIRIEWLASRELASIAEAFAIASERPLYNDIQPSGLRVAGGGRRWLPPNQAIADALDNLAARYEEMQRIEAEIRQAVIDLAEDDEAPVPIAVLARTLCVQRKTVYRWLGRSMT